MTITEFKKMLKEISSASTIALCFYLGLFSVFAYVFFSNFVKVHKFVFTVESCIFAAVFTLVAVFSVTGIVRSVKWRLYLRKNGKESISKLEGRGLIEAAVEEYNNSLQITCLANVPRGLSRSSFGERENAISDNFVYILTENIVLTFDEIARFEVVYFRRDGTDETGPDDDDIYCVTTISGKRYALIVNDHYKYTQEQTNLVNEVVAILKEKNPNCCIDMTLKYYRGGTFI